MGTCWSCNTELSLTKDGTHCDSCGSIIYYKCNSCKKSFEVINKKNKRKLKECKLCGYFLCPHCGECSWSCLKHEWEKEILKIMKPEITQGTLPVVFDKIKSIVNYMENEKAGKENRVCPKRRVPISYAKNRIKSLLAKVKGFRVKNKKDSDAFINRMEEVTDTPIGTELKISEIRENGSYGQEYRDAFNLSVCMGRLEIVKKSFIKNDIKIIYEVYKRCEKKTCQMLNINELIINVCPNTKHNGNKRFGLDMEFCPSCKNHSKGKEKDKPWKLEKKLNNKDVCQVYRGNFIKK
jgi:hypothetical protein